jgi:hypothetical protein
MIGKKTNLIVRSHIYCGKIQENFIMKKRIDR